MQHSRKELFDIFKFVCENNQWEDFFGKTREEALDEGPFLFNEIDDNYNELSTKMAFGKIRKRRAYGGTNMTNYLLRQMATKEGTPNLQNFKKIGSY